MALSNEERIAVMEAIITRLEQNMNSLAKDVKEHMAKEEEDREKMMETIADDREELLGTINDLEHKLAKQKSFVGGVIFTISSLWAVGVVAWKYITTNGGT